MSKQVTLLRVFVASPEDVKEEIESIKKIISEMNIIWEKDGIQLKVVHWKTDATPGVSEHPQDVIDIDLGDDYDIFIGIMWKRFGTRTKTAGSGTEHEFRRAYERYKEDPDSLQIMFYFNKAQPDLDDIDTDQLNQLREFKSNLGEDGVLHWDYDGIQNFEHFIRMHLSKKVQQWGELWGTGTVKVEDNENIEDAVPSEENGIYFDDEADGFIDLVEISIDSFGTSMESLNRITEAINIVGQNISDRAEELNQSQTPTPNMKHGKRILKRTADEMMQFVKRVDPEIPVFSDTFSMGIDSMTRAASITIDFQEDNREQIENVLTTVQDIKKSIPLALKSIEGLREAVNQTPRISRDINMAKKHMLVTLDYLIKEINSSYDVTLEAEKTLQNSFPELR